LIPRRPQQPRKIRRTVRRKERRTRLEARVVQGRTGHESCIRPGLYS
uniref:Capsid protein n=1 Tax=Haemonchus placei TaxID=6290 RepID=A0A0N4VZ36_HAEPC